MEIIIALTITAIIMSFITGVVVNIVQQRNEIEATSKSQLIGPAILRLMSRDLEATFVYQLDELKKKAEENAAAESGNTTQANTPFEDMKVDYFVGEDDGSDEDAHDRIMFVTSLDSKLRIGNKQSDICEVGYYLEKNDQIEDRDLYILYRREDFFIDTEPTKGGKAIKVYDRVKALEIKYYEKPENESEQEDLYSGEAEAKDDWDNTEDGGLPYAVEITIWIDLSDDKEVKHNEDYARVYKYRTLVLLPEYPTRKQLGDATSGN